MWQIVRSGGNSPHLRGCSALRLALLQRGAGRALPLLRVARLGPPVQVSHQPRRSGDVDPACYIRRCQLSDPATLSNRRCVQPALGLLGTSTPRGARNA